MVNALQGMKILHSEKPGPHSEESQTHKQYILKERKLFFGQVNKHID